jgi:hypothetical protein
LLQKCMNPNIEQIENVDTKSMKEGSLFVLFALIRSTEPGCFRLCSWCLWKALNEEGCMGLVS